MVITIGNVPNDLLIHAQLGYVMWPQSRLGVTHVFWNPHIANRDEHRESHLKELRISLNLSFRVKSSVCNFTSWDEAKF